MNSIRHGLRNVHRKKSRSAVLVLVLALSISAFVTMTAVDESVGRRLQDVQKNIGTQLELRPAGSYGLAHSSDDKNARYLPADLIGNISGKNFVSSAKGYLSMMGDFAGEHVIVMGIEPNAQLAIFGGTTGKIISGESLGSYGKNERAVLIGEGYAKRHKVNIGDSVKLKDSDVRVIGIFSSDTSYGDHGIFVPLGTMQEIFDLEGKLSSVFVDVNSMGNVGSAIGEIKNATSGVDIVDKDKASRDVVVASLGSIRASSSMGATFSLMIGSAIIFFIMLLVTRERKKEIGTLKAIGASNGGILKQFMAETMIIALAAAVVGIVFATAGGSAISSKLFSPGNILSDGQNNMKNLGAYAGSIDAYAMLAPISFNFSAANLAYVFAAAVMLGIIGVLYPAAQIFRMNPSEALKHE